MCAFVCVCVCVLVISTIFLLISVFAPCFSVKKVTKYQIRCLGENLIFFKEADYDVVSNNYHIILKMDHGIIYLAILLSSADAILFSMCSKYWLTCPGEKCG